MSSSGKSGLVQWDGMAHDDRRTGFFLCLFCLRKEKTTHYATTKLMYTCYDGWNTVFFCSSWILNELGWLLQVSFTCGTNDPTLDSMRRRNYHCDHRYHPQDHFHRNDCEFPQPHHAVPPIPHLLPIEIPTRTVRSAWTTCSNATLRLVDRFVNNDSNKWWQTLGKCGWRWL